MSIRSVLHDAHELYIAHRGASHSFPENTMTAFYEADKRGAHCIELDVHLTADNVMVILHDDTLDRTTDGSGPVAEMRWSDLEKLDAGSWKGVQFSGIRLPRLSDVLQWLPEDMYLNIEIKGTNKTSKTLSEHVLDEVIRSGCMDRIIISSFDHEALAHTRLLNAQVALGALFYRIPEGIFDLAAELQLSTLNAHWSSVHHEWVAEARTRGLQVWSWTLTSPAQIHRCRASGVQGFIVNDLGLLTVSRLQQYKAWQSV